MERIVRGLISERGGEPRRSRMRLDLENKEKKAARRSKKVMDVGGCWTCRWVSDRGPIRAGDDRNAPKLFWDQDQEAFRVISSRAGRRRGLLPVGRPMEAKQELLSWNKRTARKLEVVI